MSPLSTKVEFCRLYPNRPEYLFLAVFAFSSPFCYAKTAFSYSRALLSPCTPVLFMVKDVVKSEYRVIDMWSSFLGGRSDRKSLLRQRRNLQRAKNKHTNRHMSSTIRKEMISTDIELCCTHGRWKCSHHYVYKTPRHDSGI